MGSFLIYKILKTNFATFKIQSIWFTLVSSVSMKYNKVKMVLEVIHMAFNKLKHLLKQLVFVLIFIF